MTKGPTVTIVGFHASHEQIHPRPLLRAVQRAEEAGFDAAMCSDHFAPWLAEQGHSGFAWSWLGAALATTSFSLGVVNAPGQRYHPAIVAQAIATLEGMFPGRFWVALGSGENMNEHVTGDDWPTKVVRDERLDASAELIGRLLAGEEVTTDGLAITHRARIWSLPETPPPLFVAAVSPEKARRAAAWADGIVTVAQDRDVLRRVLGEYRDAGGRGPAALQVHVSWAPTDSEAEELAFRQWRNALVPAPGSWDFDDPADFDRATADAEPSAIRGPVFVASDPAAHLDHLTDLVQLGFDRVYVHHVGQEQDAFIDVYGSEVLPDLKKVNA